MSLKALLQKQRNSIRGILAASAIFVGGISTANAAPHQTPPKSPAARQNALLPRWQQIFAKIDAICLKDVQKKLLLRENNIPHLYLDTNGILHTGIGLNVNDYKSFQKLDFIGPKGRLLTDREKRSYFARIQNFQRNQASKGFNYNASYYANYFTILPTKESQDRMFSNRINDAMQAIKAYLGTEAYYNLHPTAQSEIITMFYNMGQGRFNPEKWPLFFAAAKNADYITMSKECHTKGVSEARNEAVATAFKSCITAKWHKVGSMYNQNNTKIAMLGQQKR